MCCWELHLGNLGDMLKNHWEHSGTHCEQQNPKNPTPPHHNPQKTPRASKMHVGSPHGLKIISILNYFCP